MSIRRANSRKGFVPTCGWLVRRLTSVGCAGLLAMWPVTRGDATAATQGRGWTLVHAAPTFGKYEDFAFPNQRSGWLANASGDILHTTDGGMSWGVQAAGLGRLRTIDFLDHRRGFAGTVNGLLYKTTDGGRSWRNITDTLPKRPLGLCGMAHVGDRLHVVGKYTGGAADHFVSSNGGQSWQVSDLRSLAYGLVDIVFLNSSVGFIGGQANAEVSGRGPATILKTTNGGRTWQPTFTHQGGRGFAWKIFPVSAKVIYAALQSEDGVYRIAKSVDAGAYWDVKIVATGRPPGPGVQAIGFLDARTGWIGGLFTGMYATTDGGETWAEVPSDDRTINRFERIAGAMFTASSRGVLRVGLPSAVPSAAIGAR